MSSEGPLVKKARTEERPQDGAVPETQPGAAGGEGGVKVEQGAGMSGLPRPPPLTLPAEPNPSTLIGVGMTGLSPLPSLLGFTSPGMFNLDSLVSGGGGHGHSGHAGNGTAGAAARAANGDGKHLLDGITPSLISPGLQWPDTMRGHAGGGLDFPMEDMDPLGSLPDNVLKNGHARGMGGEKGGKTVPSSAMASENMMPLPSPSLMELTGTNGQGGLYKGLQYDKERSLWQLFLYDGSQYRTVGEYHNELEALVAQELLSPASMPPMPNSAVNGYGDVYGRMGGNIGMSSLISPALLGSPGGLVSPMGLGNMTIQQLLGVPTPRDPGNSKNYRGVRYNRDMQAWQAYIVDDAGKLFFLQGGYDREEDAAHAHDVEALRRFGAAAETNFPMHGAGPGSAERDSSAGGLLIDNPHAPDPRLTNSGGIPPGYGYAPKYSAQGKLLGRPPRPDGHMRGTPMRGPAMMDGPPAGSTGRKRGRPPANPYAPMDEGMTLPLDANGMPIANLAIPKSKYRGVVWDPDHGKWRAQLLNDGRPVILGHFVNQEDAARQYDMAVVKGNRKERTNFPPSFYKEGRGSPAHGGRSRSSPAIRVTSQYKGVSWNSACSKWVAVLWDRELKRARHIGSFESEEDAARAYDREAIKMLGPEAGLNFRESLTDYMASTGGHVNFPEPSMHAVNKGSSQYRGVSWHERSQRWEVRVWGGGKQHFIGSFTSEMEAARAYDKAVLRLRGQDARSRSRMNFPLSEYNLEEIQNEPLGPYMRAAVGEMQPSQPIAYGRPKRGAGRRRKQEEDEEDSDEEEEEEEEELETAPSGSRNPSNPSSMPGSRAPSAPPPGSAFDDGAMRMIRELSAQAGEGGPPVPEVRVVFDENEHKWVASVPSTRTIIGEYDMEIEARNAGQTYTLNMLANMMAARGITPESLGQGQGPPGMMAGPDGGGPGVSMQEGGAPFQLQVPPEMMGSLMGQFGQQAPPAGLSTSQAVPMVDPMMLEGGRGGRPGRTLGRRAAAGVAAVTAVLAAAEGLPQESTADPSGLRHAGGPTGLTAPAPVPPGARGKSQYRGVSWCEKVKKWRALLWDGQKQRFLGHYTTDLDAARAYDRALIELKGPDAKTNFPAASYDGEPPPEDNATARKQNGSQFKGVGLNKQTGRYETRLRLGGRNLFIGSFDTEIEAARAYDCAALHARNGSHIGLNYPHENYTELELADALTRLNTAIAESNEEEAPAVTRGRGGRRKADQDSD